MRRLAVRVVRWVEIVRDEVRLAPPRPSCTGTTPRARACKPGRGAPPVDLVGGWRRMDGRRIRRGRTGDLTLSPSTVFPRCHTGFHATHNGLRPAERAAYLGRPGRTGNPLPRSRRSVESPLGLDHPQAPQRLLELEVN